MWTRRLMHWRAHDMRTNYPDFFPKAPTKLENASEIARFGGVAGVGGLSGSPDITYRSIQVFFSLIFVGFLRSCPLAFFVPVRLCSSPSSFLSIFACLLPCLLCNGSRLSPRKTNASSDLRQ